MVPGLLAKGAVNDYFRQQTLSMAFLELYPIVMAAMIWGHQWSKKRIIFRCDNLGTIHILRKGRSKCSSTMLSMRRSTWCVATNNFSFYSEFIPGIKNL